MTFEPAYSGERYIWSLAQAALAAGKYPTYPATWQGLEALQARVALSSAMPTDGPKDFNWARTAFADANARFNFQYEKVPA